MNEDIEVEAPTRAAPKSKGIPLHIKLGLAVLAGAVCYIAASVVVGQMLNKLPRQAAPPPVEYHLEQAPRAAAFLEPLSPVQTGDAATIRTAVEAFLAAPLSGLTDFPVAEESSLLDALADATHRAAAVDPALGKRLSDRTLEIMQALADSRPVIATEPALEAPVSAGFEEITLEDEAPNAEE